MSGVRIEPNLAVRLAMSSKLYRINIARSDAWRGAHWQIEPGHREADDRGGVVARALKEEFFL